MSIAAIGSLARRARLQAEAKRHVPVAGAGKDPGAGSNPEAVSNPGAVILPPAVPGYTGTVGQSRAATHRGGAGDGDNRLVWVASSAWSG